MGKTRLMLRWASTLPEGWVGGRLRSGALGVVDVVTACDEPMLIIVEAPGRRPELARLLEDVDRVTAGRVKVLLVTRYDEWLPFLREQVAEDSARIVRSARLFPAEDAVESDDQGFRGGHNLVAIGQRLEDRRLKVRPLVVLPYGNLPGRQLAT